MSEEKVDDPFPEGGTAPSAFSLADPERTG